MGGNEGMKQQSKPATVNDLIQMKQELETKSNRVRTLEGKQSALLDRLNKEFDCKTLDEANKAKKNMEAELGKRDVALIADIDNLKAKYNWDFANV
uniref:Uncharacterized protein n=1 Tax=viral metagenome TaxID=1070528 RepID=A0A6M3LLV7_9ZZZZ